MPCVKLLSGDPKKSHLLPSRAGFSSLRCELDGDWVVRSYVVLAKTMNPNMAQIDLDGKKEILYRFFFTCKQLVN